MPIEVSLGPVRTPTGLAVSAAVRDITERRRLAAAATRIAQRLTSAVESMDDAFVLFDDQRLLVLCNNAFRRLLGFADETPLAGRSHEELLRTFLAALDFPDGGARERFAVELAAASHESHAAPFDVRTLDGRSLRVLMRWTLEGGVLVTFWDLTAEERRNEEIRRAHGLAAAASAAKTEFLSSMSHELRTPLNAVLGFAQLLERDRKQPLTDRQHERVRRILSGGQQLLRLVDDVLDLARIEAGRIAISVEPVEIGEVLAEVKRTLEPMELQYGHSIQLEALPEGLPHVAVDRMRFVQVISNFCSNALKYNRPGGTVRVSAQARPHDRVRVTVIDTGIGIPLSEQELLFQPFQRAGQETGPIEGTGIGLVITRKLATLMNGEVGFDSVEGKGSTFWVEVPADHAPAEATGHVPRIRSDVVHRHGGSHRRVLYVEDNPANVAFMRDVLTMFDGIDLSTATSGEVGLEMALGDVPDAIILDINLAGEMTGLDLAKLLRASPKTSGVPLVGLSAAASADDRDRVIKAGFDHYLTKPVVLDQLVACIEAILWPSSRAPVPATQPA